MKLTKFKPKKLQNKKTNKIILIFLMKNPYRVLHKEKKIFIETYSPVPQPSIIEDLKEAKIYLWMFLLF